jgi:Uma2 family endonuclease
MATAVSKRLFTADEYHRMVEARILSEGDRVELINGEIVAMTPIGPRHNACVDRANKALVLAAGDLAIVRTQGSVRLNLYSEPQPDLVLLRPRPDFYMTCHAGADDILLVIEVADSTIDFDRDVKSRLYATSGIPEYWLADLTGNVVVRHLQPEQDAYRIVETFGRGQTLAPMLLSGCAVPVDVLLTG